jgi:hypothetical protein
MLAGGGEKTTDIADGGRETTDKRGLTRIRRIREKVTGINILIICAFFYFIKFRLRSSLFFSSAPSVVFSSAPAAEKPHAGKYRE